MQRVISLDVFGYGHCVYIYTQTIKKNPKLKGVKNALIWPTLHMFCEKKLQN